MSTKRPAVWHLTTDHLQRVLDALLQSPNRWSGTLTIARAAGLPADQAASALLRLQDSSCLEVLERPPKRNGRQQRCFWLSDEGMRLASELAEDDRDRALKLMIAADPVARGWLEQQSSSGSGAAS